MHGENTFIQTYNRGNKFTTTTDYYNIVHYYNYKKIYLIMSFSIYNCTLHFGLVAVGEEAVKSQSMMVHLVAKVGGALGVWSLAVCR